MKESLFVYAVPFALLRLWLAEDQRYLEELTSIGVLLGSTEAIRKETYTNTVNRIRTYEERIIAMRSFQDAGATFKRSVHKKKPDWEFMATNCHLQVGPDVPAGGAGYVEGVLRTLVVVAPFPAPLCELRLKGHQV